MPTRFRAYLCAVFALVLAATPLAAAPAEVPRVVTTIKPVHSLTAAVMGELGAPRLLVDGAQSPHTYDMPPSDAYALERADVVVWVGPALETFLQRPLESLARSARHVRLQDAPGVELLRTRVSGTWASAHAGHAHGGAAHAGEGHAGHEAAEMPGDGHGDSAIPPDRIDPHIWLDPANARAMVTAIADAMAEADPAHADRYRANAAATRERIAALAEEIDERLAPVRDVPFVVFHDAYHYFERAFGLNAVGAIALNPQRQPSARRLHAIRTQIRELDARCVFREPQFAPDLVATVLEGTSAREGVLDPLGAELDAGPAAYPTLLRRLAQALRDCLGAS